MVLLCYTGLTEGHGEVGGLISVVSILKDLIPTKSSNTTLAMGFADDAQLYGWR
jgi:hypothetical protein